MSSGSHKRNKGLRGELEVRHEFERAGYEARNLEGQGDNLIVLADGLLLHLETKRQERLELPKWWRQAEREAPANAVPLVVFRRSREDWRVCLRLSDFIAILGRADDAQVPGTLRADDRNDQGVRT